MWWVSGDVSPFASPKLFFCKGFAAYTILCCFCVQRESKPLAQMANILRRFAPFVRCGVATSRFSKENLSRLVCGSSRIVIVFCVLSGCRACFAPPCMRLISDRGDVSSKGEGWKNRMSDLWLIIAGRGRKWQSFLFAESISLPPCMRLIKRLYDILAYIGGMLIFVAWSNELFMI